MEVKSIMTPRPLSVTGGLSVAEALRMMDEQDIRHLPVVSEGRVVGMVSDRDLIDHIGWRRADASGDDAVEDEGAVRDIMQTPVSTVSPQDTLVTAAVQLVLETIGCLPVVEDGKLKGILTEMDLLMAFWGACREQILEGDIDPPVSLHMSTDLVTGERNTTVREATAMCAGRHVRHLPIVDGGRLVGIVSDRDLRAARSSGAEGWALERIMTSEPAVVQEDDPLSKVAELIVTHKVSAIPVTAGRHLVGIVSIKDVLDHCLSTLRAPDEG